MSNMAEISQLTEMSVQLPIEWYLDPKILEIEKQLLFVTRDRVTWGMK